MKIIKKMILLLAYLLALAVGIKFVLIIVFLVIIPAVNRKGIVFDETSIGENLYYFESNSLKGVRDSSGKVLIGPKYDYVFPFHEGFAKVSIPDPKSQSFINREGKEIAPLHFGYTGDFKEGLAWAETRQCIPWNPSFAKADLRRVEYCLTGYLEGSGKFRIPPQFHLASDFDCGVASVHILRLNPFPQLLAAVIDKDGKFLSQPNAGVSIRGFVNCTAQFQDNNTKKWGFVGRDGKVFIPATYDFVYEFNRGIAIVQQGNLYGAISENGKVLVPLTFQDVAGPGLSQTTLISPEKQLVILPDGRITEKPLISRILEDITWWLVIYALFPMTWGPPG